MRDAVGGSLLLNIVIIFLSVVIVLFAGIMAYSKAYKVKNRIIEIIEREKSYNISARRSIESDLRLYGYKNSNITSRKCGYGNLNTSTFFYCVYERGNLLKGTTYEVVTYVQFDFPIIGDWLVFPVKGQTKVLNKSYDY